MATLPLLGSMCLDDVPKPGHLFTAGKGGTTPTLMRYASVSDDACGLRPAPPGKRMCYWEAGGMQAGLLQPRSPCQLAASVTYHALACEWGSTEV